MIRIDRGAEVRPGQWAFSSALYPSVAGISRQPLLDSCRMLRRMGGLSSDEQVGVFQNGSDIPAITCPLGLGAETTVSEADKGAIKFQRYVDLAGVFGAKK